MRTWFERSVARVRIAPAERPSMKRQPAVYLAQVLLLTAAYLAAAWLGAALLVPHGRLWLFWPPAGIALAALLRFGPQLWPAIFLGSLLHNLGFTDRAFRVAVGIALANTVQALLGEWLLRRAIGFRPALDRMRDIIGLVALGTLATLVGSVLGIASFGLSPVGTPEAGFFARPFETVLRIWIAWLLQTAMGIVLVVPFLLTWSVPPVQRLPRRQLVAAGGLLLALAVLAAVVFSAPLRLDNVSYPLAYAVMPILIWMAIWLGPRGAATGTFVVAVVAFGFSVGNAPRLSAEVFREGLLELQAFLGIAAVTSLALAAAVAERRQAAESLRRSELQFRLVWEESVDGMRLLDREGTILQVNAAFCQLVDLDEARLVGRPFAVAHAPSERETLLTQYRRAVRDGGLESQQEVQVELWNGKRLWVEHSNSPVQLPGQPLRVLSVFRDVGPRKETEAALRRGIERYRSLFEAHPHPMWVYDQESLAIVAVNDAAVEHYGWTREEFLRMTLRDLRPPEEVPQLVEYLKQQVPGIRRGIHWRHRKKDGTRIEVLVDSHEIEFGDRPARVVMATDITQHVQAEEALRGSEAKYRSLVENLEQSVFLKDRDLSFVAVNQPFCRSVSKTEAEIVGRTDYDLYPRRLAEKYRADDHRVLEQGQRVEVEEQSLIAGQPRTVRIVKTPVKDDRGTIVGVLGIFWDVTDQRALESQLRQAQKMEAVGQLAGGVAHDFNNLLTVILGNLSLVLSRWPPGEEGREMLVAASKGGQRAADLVRQLLGFSRRSVLRAQSLDLTAQVAETVAMLKRTIDPRIAVEVLSETDLWPVHADPGQINQVLMNLCLNSRDAMPDGGRLTLETTNVVIDEGLTRFIADAQPGDYVRLRVRDTGHGIPPEVRSRIFDPFFTTKERGKGTGLGLAMVFGIVKQHQGWIECRSETGRGTTFDVFLPRSQAAPTQAVSVSRPMPQRGTETILLVDDEAMIRQLGSQILRQQGYQVLVAENGWQALTVYQRERGRIDLVILDLTMPQVSGQDTLRHLRKLDPHVRVLYSSGYSADKVTESEAEGVLGFLSKPYSPREMAEQVREVLDRCREPAGR